MPQKALTLAVALATLLLSACAPAQRTGATSKMTQQPFGKTPAGEDVALYTLTNSKGFAAAITTYGGIVVSLKAPDRAGRAADVVLGFENLEGYLKGHPYFGAIIGRYGNRIAKGRFTLDGVAYKLAQNNGENHLHGGIS
ncbi:MAG: galactose-1-epimerase, partial [Acidobacteria bacterium]|nr:galactose-1-epimerase [Acidobacteriota bacterium]